MIVFALSLAVGDQTVLRVQSDVTDKNKSNTPKPENDVPGGVNQLNPSDASPRCNIERGASSKHRTL